MVGLRSWWWGPFLPSHTSSLGGEGWGEADTDGDEADEGKREGKVRPGRAEEPLFTLFGLEHIMACVCVWSRCTTVRKTKVPLTRKRPLQAVVQGFRNRVKDLLPCLFKHKTICRECTIVHSFKSFF